MSQKSLHELTNEIGKLLAEYGTPEGAPEFKALDALTKKLSTRDDYDAVPERGGEGREKKLDLEGIRRIIELRNRGLSHAKIGAQVGVVGMMVSNICRGKIYKKELAILREQGIFINQ
jgi:hypothetical protein